MTTRPHVGFVLERSLGHVTHADNLARALPTNAAVEATLLPIDYAVDGLAARVPVYGSNWTVRAGLRADRAIARLDKARPLDALFIHTQVPAVLAQRWMRKVPTVVSLDATPLQYDELGEFYGHTPGAGRSEQWKYKANRAALHKAVHVVAWTEWTRQGIIDGYGVAPERVTVIPPGVTPSLWNRAADAPEPDGPLRILFVGGDLPRKGGDVLLAAFARLRHDLASAPGSPAVELHLATGAAVAEQPDVHVHRGMKPNSPELIALYHRSHVFCLPTRGDCLPMVLSEAGAAGLPLVSTAVAGIPEIVLDDETGVVVPVGDVDALTAALRRLVDDPPLRRRLGSAARTLVAERFDADRNADRLVELIAATALGRGRS